MWCRTWSLRRRMIRDQNMIIHAVEQSMEMGRWNLRLIHTFKHGSRGEHAGN
jgi:hypothetical protein